MYFCRARGLGRMLDNESCWNTQGNCREDGGTANVNTYNMLNHDLIDACCNFFPHKTDACQTSNQSAVH